MSTKSANEAASTQHATFVIDRTFDAPVARVFKAFADKDAKARWFGGGSKWKPIERAFDFRIGGRETAVGEWDGGAVTDFRATYYDIIPNARIIYAYDMYHSGRHLSVSLATIEFTPDGDRTRMKLTEQGAFLDGYDDSGSREHGTIELMNRLAATLT
jgi:uncharacterized protein YndB with AHSA1/START domain